MTARKISLFALFAGIMAFAFNACDDSNPTFYPSDQNNAEDILNPGSSDTTEDDPPDTTEVDTTVDLLVRVKTDQAGAQTAVDSAKVELAYADTGTTVQSSLTDESFPEQCSDSLNRAAIRDIPMRTIYLRTNFSLQGGGDYADTTEIQLPTPALGAGDVGCYTLEASEVE